MKMNHPVTVLLTLLLLTGRLTTAASQPLDTDALRDALTMPERPVADRMRDADRRPVETLEFLQLGAGMTVLDVYAAGGYYTWILSHAVGEQGTVLAQNSPRALRYGEVRSDVTQGDALAEKLDQGVLDNVRRIDRAIHETGLPAGSVDFVLLSQILHDYYNRNPRRALGLLEILYGLLKPGGILGIIDHRGVAGADNARLHRMTEADARRVAEEAGFTIEAESDLLAQPDDNPLRSIFDPMLARRTDQFLLRLRRPESP